MSSVQFKMLLPFFTLWLPMIVVSRMYLRGLINRVDLNGMSVERADENPIIISVNTTSFRVPVRETGFAIYTTGNPISVRLENIEGDTGKVLFDCFQLLRQRIANLSAIQIAKELYQKNIHNESILCHLAQSLEPGLGPRAFQMAMETLEIDARTESPEKWMVLSNLMHGIGNQTSIWMLSDSQKMKKVRNGDSEQLTKDILFAMTPEELLEKETFIIDLGNIVYNQAGGGERGIECLVEIVEDFIPENGKGVIVESLFEEIEGFQMPPSSKNIHMDYSPGCGVLCCNLM